MLIAARGGMADEPSRVVIVPFKIHADRDLSFLKQGILDMLTSRLSWENKVVVVSREETSETIKGLSEPLDEATARTLGTRLGASHVLFGSLTMFGNSVSLDGKMVDVLQKRPTLTFFKQSSEIGEVIPQVNLFASEIQEKVFGRPVAAPQQVAQVREGADIYAHPEKLLSQGVGAQAMISPGPSGGFMDSDTSLRGEAVSPVSWKSQNFKTVIMGIALGDVDGDGRNEVVFITDRELYVHRLENQRLLKIWEKEGDGSHKFIGVDVADVNGDGRAEIFVTSVRMPAQVPDSFVVEWDGSAFRTVSEGDSWYYRVINVPDRGPVLVGQRGRREDIFVPGVHELTWQHGGYGASQRLSLPKGVNVFGFAIGDVMNNGEQMIVAFDEEDHIRLFSSSGEEQWRSEEAYGGSMNYLEHGDTADDLKERLFLAQRIFIRDTDDDGKNEVIISSNKGMLGRLMAHFRRFSGGRIESLSWNSTGLAPDRHTPKVSGHISDYAVGDFDHDGSDEVVVTQVARLGTVVTGASSSIIGYELRRSTSAR